MKSGNLRVEISGFAPYFTNRIVLSNQNGLKKQFKCPNSAFIEKSGTWSAGREHPLKTAKINFKCII